MFCSYSEGEYGYQGIPWLDTGRRCTLLCSRKRKYDVYIPQKRYWVHPYDGLSARQGQSDNPYRFMLRMELRSKVPRPRTQYSSFKFTKIAEYKRIFTELVSILSILCLNTNKLLQIIQYTEMRVVHLLTGIC